MNKFYRHFVVMKALAIVTSFTILFFIDLSTGSGILSSKVGMMVVILVTLIIYVALTIGIALHDNYKGR
jgi:hypothetical protein